MRNRRLSSYLGGCLLPFNGYMPGASQRSHDPMDSSNLKLPMDRTQNGHRSNIKPRSLRGSMPGQGINYKVGLHNSHIQPAAWHVWRKTCRRRIPPQVVCGVWCCESFLHHDKWRKSPLQVWMYLNAWHLYWQTKRYISFPNPSNGQRWARV